jgi:peptidoglycan/xylan/chitin deacetylase (PgdA/CDA1 family)
MASIWTKLPKSIQRRAARWFGRRPCWIRLQTPIISFTFDDFPRSAFLTGGAILQENGAVGTYYASLGLMDTVTSTGQIFACEDLEELTRNQHEIACHTFDHCDSWGTEPSDFEASVRQNQKRLAELIPTARFGSLSYPLSWPRPQTKRRIARHYQCARGGGQTFNAGIADLNYLKAFFIEQSRDNFDEISGVIDSNAGAQGWLIFATHDVCGSPTRFGCTPDLFERVVKYSARSGAAILPVGVALRKIQQGAGQKIAAGVPESAAAC